MSLSWVLSRCLKLLSKPATSLLSTPKEEDIALSLPKRGGAQADAISWTHSQADPIPRTHCWLFQQPRRHSLPSRLFPFCDPLRSLYFKPFQDLRPPSATVALPVQWFLINPNLELGEDYLVHSNSKPFLLAILNFLSYAARYTQLSKQLFAERSDLSDICTQSPRYSVRSTPIPG